MYIQIKPGGRTTDQIIRYAVALYIQKKYPTSQIVNYTNSDWGIETTRANIDSSAAIAIGRTEIENIDKVLEGRPQSILVTWPILNVEIFRAVRSDLQNLLAKLPQNSLGNRSLKDDELLIHLRMGDITQFVHRDYWPLPIRFYEKLCAREGRKPVFIGELFKHPGYLEKIQEIMPDARMMTPGTIMEDFLRINTAKQVALSLSSYSWLATWLSKTADRIHMPYCGFFSDLRRPDVRLRDPNDTRYHYHILPNLNWKVTPNVLKRNLEVNCRYSEIASNVTLWEEDPRKLTPSERIQKSFKRLKRHISR